MKGALNNGRVSDKSIIHNKEIHTIVNASLINAMMKDTCIIISIPEQGNLGPLVHKGIVVVLFLLKGPSQIIFLLSINRISRVLMH